MSDAEKLPTYIDLMLPTLQALEALGGSATIDDLNAKIQELAGITAEQMAVRYENDESQRGSKLEHRMAFARTYLKKLGAIDNPDRGLYALSDEGSKYLRLEDPDAEVRHKEHELRVGKTPTVFLRVVDQQIEQEPEYPITVRELLAEWGVSRRGSHVIDRITRDLEGHRLATRPNFADVAIDDTISILRFIPEPGGDPDSSSDAPTEERIVRHTITVGNLPSAGSGVVCVTPNDSVQKAQSLMESHDFSQLPVMTSAERGLVGVITWESIAKASMYDGIEPQTVRDAMIGGINPVPAEEPLLEHVGSIADAGFVFVKSAINVITGIVTTADLSVQFAQLANPFLLIGEIEGWLRLIIDDVFDPDELLPFVDPEDSEREIHGGENLTFGEYVRLFQNTDAWSRLGWPIHQATFTKHLEQVKSVRNSIMHFSPDPPEPAEVDDVRRLLAWVRRLAE